MKKSIRIHYLRYTNSRGDSYLMEKIVCIILILFVLIPLGACTIQSNSSSFFFEGLSPTLDSNSSLLQDTVVGSTITFGRYEQSGGISNGEEEIEWLILARENDRILVISKKILERIAYDSLGGYFTPAWDNSAVCLWLNSSFLNGAFSPEERKRIATVTVTNDIRDSQDQVFLLNSLEAKSYFSSADERKCDVTSFAYANNHWEAGRAWEFDEYDELSEYGRNCWLLRAQGSFGSIAAYVDGSGEICEAYGNGLGNFINGVRPAMWIITD